LQDLKTHISCTRNSGSNAQGEASRPPAPLSSVIPPSSQSTPPDAAKVTVAEGESSLSAHSVFIKDFLRTFVDADDTQQIDPEIQQTLNALSNIVKTSKQQPLARELVLPHAKVQSPVQQRKYDLPPIQDAVALIRAAQSEHSTIRWSRLGVYLTDFIDHQHSTSPVLAGYTSM
jgi:hypothetical protein